MRIRPRNLSNLQISESRELSDANIITSAFDHVNRLGCEFYTRFGNIIAFFSVTIPNLLTRGALLNTNIVYQVVLLITTCALLWINACLASTGTVIAVKSSPVKVLASVTVFPASLLFRVISHPLNATRTFR